MSEKPRCSTCPHYLASKGRCEHADSPEVFVQFAPKSKDAEAIADRTVTGWRIVDETDGCSNHIDFERWLTQQKAVSASSAVSIDMNMIDPLGPYNCTCVMLKPADSPYRLPIDHNGRALSSKMGCEICLGKGIVPKNKMNRGDDYSTESEEVPVRINIGSAHGSGFAMDDNGDLVMTIAGSH